jgi:hypothetical protein
MCRQCKHETGSTKHLLYWQAEWFKRFLTTWYHIINRKAYHKFLVERETENFIKIIKSDLPDDGIRIEADGFFKGK